MSKFNKAIAKIVIPILILSCGDSVNQQKDTYTLGGIGAFSEMVGAGVKKLALSAALDSSEMDRVVEEAKRIASEHGVSIYRESDLIQTDLFPADVATGKDVLLIYNGTTLDDYQSLKKDIEKSTNAGAYNPGSKERIELSRRFGRMLSYSPAKINQLLSQNTAFRTLSDFGVQATNLFLYYKDLDRAKKFYTEILGMEMVADYGMAYILRMAWDSYLILVDESEGMHSAEEPKTVALALLTDQLSEWYDHLIANNVPIKYEYTPKEGGAHDGFVAIDPEGYLLEFELFKQHLENEDFVGLLAQNKKSIIPTYQQMNGLSIHSTITWLYYDDVLAMEDFFQNVLGFSLVADQGWTKIYQASRTGFMAIVDGRRGMHKPSEKKAVNVGFIVNDLDSWFEYVDEHKPFELRSNSISEGPDGKYRAFVGYDPDGYYLEFDHFYEHTDNSTLIEYLDSSKK